MKIKAIVYLLLISRISLGQQAFSSYLAANRQDLTQHTSLQIDRAKMIGFGALHGSSRTEETEVILIKELAENHSLKYYLPETDFSTGNYFQEYIDGGDEDLLKELIFEYGSMVPQEKSVEAFEKWKAIRPYFLEHDIKVLGVDMITSYKFPFKEFLLITEENSEWKYRDTINSLLQDESTKWSRFENSNMKSLVQRVIEHYEVNVTTLRPSVRDTFKFDHLITNLKHLYESDDREATMLQNFRRLNDKYTIDTSLVFARFGIFHLMKSKINHRASFFSMLVEHGVYASTELVTMQGFLTKSSVMWNKFNYKTGKTKYATKKGFGIGDYVLEHFHKIKELKKNKLSDITLFKLNDEDSPYSEKDEYRLIKVKKLFGNSGWNPTVGKSTLDYIDYAILISNSPANRPIVNLK